MLVRRRMRWKKVLRNSRAFLIYIISLSSLTYLVHWLEANDYSHFAGLAVFHIPFALIATLATALAIFLAFRNNSAYDRWWEARKIWGGIVNISRSLGRQITTFTQLADADADELYALKREVIYRHIAWLNALRLQLRREDSWDEIKPFVDPAEFAWLLERKNVATQLVQKQGECLAEARRKGLLIDSRYHELLDESLTVLYDLQGKAERIKNTPLPRQYDYFPRMFNFIFVTLLPSGMMSQLQTVHHEWLVIPLATVVGFIFYVLMRVGEFNEDPFEGRFSDTPMTALCRTIEIDMREQLGETGDDIPPKVEPVDGVLM